MCGFTSIGALPFSECTGLDLLIRFLRLNVKPHVFGREEPRAVNSGGSNRIVPETTNRSSWKEEWCRETECFNGGTVEQSYWSGAIQLKCPIQESSTAMPKGKRREREANWEREASGREESNVNASGSNSTDSQNGIMGVTEIGNGSGNDNTTDHANNRGRHRNGAPQQSHQNPGLGQWAEAVKETVQSLGGAHRAINGLQGKLALHMNDLAAMDETRNRVTQLEEICGENKKEIERQEHTITTLTMMGQKAKASIEQKTAELQKERAALDQEISKQEKRVTMAIAEGKHNLQSEYEKLTKQHGRSYDERRKELEGEFSSRREENEKVATSLKAERQQLLATVDKQKKTIEIQSRELEKATEQCDVLERAKNSIKREKRDRETEIEMLKKEFGLNSKPAEYLYTKSTTNGLAHANKK